MKAAIISRIKKRIHDMKTYSKFMTTALLAAACCLFLGVGVARADDDEQGGDIDGTESLEVEVQMTPTNAAPAGSSIELSLEAEDDDGTTQAELKLETQNLTPGTYNVSVTLKSTGATVALGSFTVDSQGQAEVEFTTNPQDGDDVPFPTNFNPFDIATVSVSNASGVVLFTADLTKVATTMTTLTANIVAQAGPTDPGATGNALLNATASHTKPTGSLQITGQGLPVSTPLSVSINGVASNVKKVSTSSTGNVSIIITPKGKAATVASGVNLLQIKSATLSNKSGNVLLKFSF